jgi:uncharacterized protein
MIPQFPQFKPIELSDRKEIELITSQFAPYSDFNFTSLWSWNTGSGRSISILNGNLVILFRDYITEEPFYTFIGSKDVYDTACALIKHANKMGYRKNIFLLPEEVVKNSLSELKNKFLVIEDRNNFDYVYSVNSLVTLEGGSFETIRNLKNRFTKRYQDIRVSTLDLLDPEVRRQIQILTARWSEQARKSGDDEQEIENELESMQRHVSYSESLPIIAIGVFVGDQLVGLSTNEKLSNGFAIAHYRKADTSFAGVYQFLEHETVKILQSCFCTYLNYEQDLGILPLRKGKESYRPVFFLKKFILKRKLGMSESMSELMKKNFSAKFLSAIFLVITLWWLSINARGLHEGAENNIFTLVYPIISLIGGLVGVNISRKWGSVRSYFGSAIMLFSLGLLLQFFGQASYAWLIYVQGVEVPYPSIGDIGYYGSVWAYVFGAFVLTKVMSPLSFKSLRGKTISLMLGVPAAMVLFSYWVFLRDYELYTTSYVNIFLDFAYPITQAVYVSLAIALYFGSRKVLGGIMRGPMVTLLAALVVQYISDFMFLFQTKAGTWYVGGLNDYLYFLSYCAMWFALIRIGHAYTEIINPQVDSN